MIKIDIKNSLYFENLFTKVISDDGKKPISALVGKRLSEPYVNVILSYYFDDTKWTKEEAQSWVVEHGKTGDWILGKKSNRGGNKKMKPIKKSYNCELKNFDDEKLSFEAIASTNEVDRDGDILRVNGWVLKDFKKNPVMLWAHNSYLLPVGRAENVRKENDKLIFEAVFTPKDLNPFGEQIYRMYKAKFINAFSVRFDPKEWKERIPEDGKSGGERFGREYTKQDLLEVSPVTIPSLPSALINRDYQNMVLKAFQYENSMLIEDEEKRKEMLDSDIKICVDCGVCKDEFKPGFEETENEIRYRVRDPGQFQDGSFKRITLKKDKPRVFAVIGRPKGQTTTKIQSVRFPKEDGWNMTKAKAWVKDHPEIKKEYSDEEIIEPMVIKHVKETIGDYSYEEIITEKSGRVLSAKNRGLVNLAIETIGKTTAALQALLEAAEPPKEVNIEEEIKRLKNDIKELNKNNNDDDIIKETEKIIQGVESLLNNKEEE